MTRTYYAVLHAEHTAAASTATTGVDLQRSRHLIEYLIDLVDFAGVDVDVDDLYQAIEDSDVDTVIESLGHDYRVLSGTRSELAELAETLAASAHRYQRLVAEALRDLLRELTDTPQSLSELLGILRADPSEDNPAASRALAAVYDLPVAHGVLDWTELPTFGGADVDGPGVWSWDGQSVLVGSCADDLRVVARSQWAQSGRVGR